ncbi:hypothetical protein J3R82DRAFT_1963 [Butyriboletus roseoflavus]|nr:hypothetical protein J3R82DRAFT_1963 [Butyriboletus roseoflavus]
MPAHSRWYFFPMESGQYKYPSSSSRHCYKYKIGTDWILDAERQTLTIETNDRHARKVSALDVSTDSLTVASGSSDGSVVIWSVATGQRLAEPSNLDASKISSVQFSSCGGRLAGCTSIGTVYILDIHDNQISQRVTVKFNSRVTAFSWSDDVNGQQRIFTGLEESLAVIDPSHGSDSRRPIPSFRTLSRNGRFIVSGTGRDGIRFWDAATFVEIGPNLPACLPLAISPDNSLVTVSLDAQHHSLSIWNLSDILPKCYTISVSPSFFSGEIFCDCRPKDDEVLPSPLAIYADSQVLGFEGEEAIEIFNTMLSNIQFSPNPEIHRQCELYASPSQRRVAETIIFDVLGQRPPVLIDTRTGRICHGPLRILTLEVDPTYRNLLSFIEERDEIRFRRGVETFFEYVMLSHKWEETTGSKEPSFQDVLGKSIYTDLDRSPTNDKLRGFCELVRETGHRWAWSDTCCIDRTESSVLSKAIVSMYRWYEESALTLALLTGVPSPSRLGNLRDSIWMRRAWTLQELLAPKAIRFYDSEWKLYLNDPHHNHKDSPVINTELASAVSVAPKMLSAFQSGRFGVREKLRLASTRTATIEEDISYSLFGIFASDLQPKYGEGKNALGRLLEEIVHRSGDVTVLAWTGNSSRFNSCLPAEIAVYEEPPQMVSPSNANKLRAQAVELRSLWPREAAVAMYGRIAKLPKASGISMVINGVYRASVSVLGDVRIKTANPLPLRDPGRLLLVHPWIRDLSNPLASPGSDDYGRALWLIARLEQKFSALMLQRQPYGGYQRVAADYEIVVQLPRITPTQSIRTEVLALWNEHAGPRY